MTIVVSVLFALLPLIFGGYWCFAINDIIPDSDMLFIWFHICFPLAAYVLSLLYPVFRKNQTKRYGIFNLISKIIAIPTDCYVLKFYIERMSETQNAASDGAEGVMFGVLLLFFVTIPYLLGRIFMLVSQAVVALRVSWKWYHVVLHLIPIADIASAAIIVFTLFKKQRESAKNEALKIL